MDVEETPVPRPSAPAQSLGGGTFLQPPLSRRGHGPGILIIGAEETLLRGKEHILDPPPLQKWAEEGYPVLAAGLPLQGGSFKTTLERGIQALKELPECDVKDKFGLILYDTTLLASADVAALDAIDEINAVICYGSSIECSKPQLVHLPASADGASASGQTVTVHKYPGVQSANFILPKHAHFSNGPAAVAHTRCLTFLKPKLGGPNFDLEAIWEEHTYFEFAERSVAKTMGTMVQEPYVNHVPTMTGGIGRARLQDFYRYHFIWNNPKDTNLELVSRTVGIDRVIDEFICTFTHTEEIDWLIPGIPPTNKPVRLPAVSIVNVRGDRLYHEHIWWDQATLLVQLGLMPEYLPFPYALPDGRVPGPGKRFEFRVPAVGVETAHKLQDENSVESNLLFGGGIREV